MSTKLVLPTIIAGALALASSPALAADFSVTAPGFTAYVINGANNPTLTLSRGHTYTLDVNTPGHPFFIKTAQVTGSGSTFDTGVTNNGATAGTVSFAVPASAPATLFYQCGVHAAMTGTLTIVTPAVPASGALTLGLAGLSLLALAFLALGRARRGLARRRTPA